MIKYCQEEIHTSAVGWREVSAGGREPSVRQVTRTARRYIGLSRGNFEMRQGGGLAGKKLRADPLRDQPSLPRHVQEPLEPQLALRVPCAGVVVNVHTDEPVGKRGVHPAPELHGVP